MAKIKAGDYVIDKYDGRKKKVHSVQGELIFIGKDHEPVRMHEITIIQPSKKSNMATKRKTTRKKSTSVGVKANGQLKKGYRYKKGGGVVKAKAKR